MNIFTNIKYKKERFIQKTILSNHILSRLLLNITLFSLLYGFLTEWL